MAASDHAQGAGARAAAVTENGRNACRSSSLFDLHFVLYVPIQHALRLTCPVCTLGAASAIIKGLVPDLSLRPSPVQLCPLRTALRSSQLYDLQHTCHANTEVHALTNCLSVCLHTNTVHVFTRFYRFVFSARPRVFNFIDIVIIDLTYGFIYLVALPQFLPCSTASACTDYSRSAHTHNPVHAMPVGVPGLFTRTVIDR